MIRKSDLNKEYIAEVIIISLGVALVEGLARLGVKALEKRLGLNVTEEEEND